MTQEALPRSTARRVPELEGLRAVLALWVLVYHVLTISGWWQRLPAIVRNVADGGNAVDIFILLSGFVITGLLLSTRETYLRFLWRRYARLMPVFLLCLAAALTAQSLGFMPVSHNSRDFAPLLGANLMLMQGAVPQQWIPGASGALLNPAWSISLEWQFYLVAPLLVALLARGRARFVLASVCCIMAYRLLVPHLVGFSGAFLPMKINLFWVGILSALVYRRDATEGGGGRTWHAVALVSLAAAALFLPYAQNIGLLLWLGFMVMLASKSTVLRRVFASKPVVALGGISYPLYLLHEVVIWVFVAFWKPQGWAQVLALTIEVIAVTGVLAWVLHVVVEEPANRFAKGVGSARHD